MYIATACNILEFNLIYFSYVKINETPKLCFVPCLVPVVAAAGHRRSIAGPPNHPRLLLLLVQIDQLRC